MRLMHRFAAPLLLALALASVAASAALAQGPGGGGPGPGPPPDPWIVNGNTINPGSFKVLTIAPTTSLAGFNLAAGTAPTSPINGDLWTTSNGLYVQINGATVGPLSGPSAGSFAATRPLSVTFPSSVVTYALNFNSSLLLDGSNNLGLNLGHVNIWTVNQTFQNTIGATSTDGLLLANAAAAANNAQQWSPRLRFSGNGWKTNATAASETVDWIIENQSQQGTTNPGTQLVFSVQINGSGYTPEMILANNAQLVIGQSGGQPGIISLFSLTSGLMSLVGANGANGTATIPSGTYQLVGDSLTQVLTNKTLTSPIISQIYGGTAAGSSLNLTSTSSGSPSGDAINILGNTITLTALTAGGPINLGIAGSHGAVLTIAGGTSGALTLQTQAAASGTLSLPNGTDTLVARNTTDTLTNKTLTSPTLTGTATMPDSGTWTSFGIGSVTGVGMTSSALLSWNSDTFISRASAANIQLGAADAAAPVQQELSVQNVVAGTLNTSPPSFFIQGPKSTGNATGGAIVFTVSPAGVSGTAQNTTVNAMVIGGTGGVQVDYSLLVGGGIGNLGVILTVNKNTANPSVVPTGTTFQLTGQDANHNFQVWESFQNGSPVTSWTILRNARGTGAAPTASGSGDTLGAISFEGYDGSAFGIPGSVGASIQAVTSEAWATSGTHYGTDLQFWTTPNATAAGLANYMTLSHAGALNLVSAILSIKSASANALAVGSNGASNPVLNIDASTASQVAGLNIKGAVTGGTVAIATVDSGAANNLTINALGTGTIGIGNVSTGAVTITPALTLSAALTYGGVTLSNAVTGTGNMVLSANPTFTGTVNVAALTASGVIKATSYLSGNTSSTTGTGLNVGGTVYFYSLTAGSGTAALCLTAAFQVETDTSSTICGISALRYKNLIAEITPDQGVAGMLSLRGMSYRYKPNVPGEDGGKNVHISLIADDMAAMNHDCAEYSEDGVENYMDRCYEAYQVAFDKKVWEIVGKLADRLPANDNLREELKRVRAR
jgi:hypothetical protein